jgi:hypothetical protein
MQNWKTTRLLRGALIFAAAGLVAACGGGSSGTATPQGTLKVSLTDAPACGFDNVYVTVDRVRVHQNANAGDNDAGWQDVALNAPTKIDLLSLQNGALFELGQTALPAGQYQQIRLVLESNSGSGAPANSVTLSGGDGSEIPVQTPSAMQSGLKLIHPFTVEPDTLVDVTLDFNACKSIVKMGNGQYILKPVVSMIPMVVSGSITGTLSTTLSGTAVTQAFVSAQKDGTIVRATAPDDAGNYTLAPIDARYAPFDLVVTMSGAATSVVGGVPLTAGSTTTVPAIQMSTSSSMGAVSGTVTGPNGSLPASVRAQQDVTATGPQVEVASTNTDGAGAYNLTLPQGAVLLSSYSSGALTFSSSGTAVGTYTIEATGMDGSKGSQPLDIHSGAGPFTVGTITLAP